MQHPLVWQRADGPVPYPEAVARMEDLVQGIRAGLAPETVWLLEHPSLYTAGTSAHDEDLLTPDRFPVYRSGRGGQYTYHGPGQRIAYVMLDLQQRGPDIRAYVHDLEEWVIQALARFDVHAERRAGRVGIWVDMSRHGGAVDDERKIAAIGVRVRRWVTFHGVAINRAPNLDHFAGIVPCGIREHGVTSLAALDRAVTSADLDDALIDTFTTVFG